MNKKYIYLIVIVLFRFFVFTLGFTTHTFFNNNILYLKFKYETNRDRKRQIADKIGPDNVFNPKNDLIQNIDVWLFHIICYRSTVFNLWSAAFWGFAAALTHKLRQYYVTRVQFC